MALQPDFVLASTSINRLETVDALARLGIAVYTSDPHTIARNAGFFCADGGLMGAGKQGDAVVAGLRGRLGALRERLSDRPWPTCFSSYGKTR